MRPLARFFTSLILLPMAAHAENYSIDWFAVAGGGLRSAGGKYSLHGTVGQPAAGSMAGKRYTVVGGFWSFSAPAPTTGIYLGINLTDPVQALADSDGDGVSNLMEYALGTDPHTPGDIQSAMASGVTQVGSGRYLALGFKRRKASTGLPVQYIPEVSGDGQTWSSANVVEVSAVPFDSQFDWVTVRDLVPTTVGSPRVIRLRVVEN